MNSVNSSEKMTPSIAPRFAESDAEQRTLGLLTAEWSDSLVELICAAAISDRFCQKLLSDPDVALVHGFNGQRFVLTPQELHLVRSIRATSLAGLIQELKDRSILEQV